jgi:histidine kinase/histidine kinase/DNA gyrase B/HSP90-like ATPase
VVSIRRPDVDSQRLLAVERDSAERLLNAVRLVVLALLAGAALAYAPSLPHALNVVNASLLAITLTWTVGQHRIFYQRARLPGWLSVTNSIIDITAVTALIAAYGVAYSPALALKAPIVAAYFVILAALPVASTTRKSAWVSALVVAEYAVLMTAFLLSGRLSTVVSPVSASASGAVSLLDEGAKILLLACAGAVATYATHWQERLSRRFSEAALESEQLQARLDQARLQALRLQLQPHFLFNTLNTITALVHRDPPSAERMVTGLSELLRVSLGTAGEQEVRLDRELEVLRHYIDIQLIRFSDRLSVRYDIDPAAREAMVPSLLLQPLVENAIKHGITPRSAAGQLHISVRRRNETLALEVIDDGVGASGAKPLSEGVGLGNARARLASLYGTQHRFEAGPRREGGFNVTIEIPFHTEPRVPRDGGGGALA